MYVYLFFICLWKHEMIILRHEVCNDAVNRVVN